MKWKTLSSPIAPWAVYRIPADVSEDGNDDDGSALETRNIREAESGERQSYHRLVEGKVEERNWHFHTTVFHRIENEAFFVGLENNKLATG